MVTWPADLPQAFRVQGFQREYAENRLRSENDAGPAKVRRRTSLNVGKMRGSMVMNHTQKTAFDTFVIDTLIGGSLQFEFPDPTGGTLILRFGETLPEVAQEAPDLYSVTMDLEILP